MSPKSILITGCSSGIGYDAAHTLAKKGWKVFATCRKLDDCARLEDEGLTSFPLDLASEDSIAAAVEQVRARTGGTLDALFNNGAFAIPGLASDLPRGALREIYETNLFGQIDLTNRILPMMHAQGHGRVIMNSSVLGFVGLRARAAYVSTKFAMEGFTDVYRLENRHENLHFILIQPGPITTLIRENSRAGFEKWIDWENAPRRTFYEKLLIPRLYAATKVKPDRFELPPSAVTDKLLKALEAPKPKPRYAVTTPTYFLGYLKRVVSTRTLDRVLRKI